MKNEYFLIFNLRKSLQKSKSKEANIKRHDSWNFNA